MSNGNEPEVEGTLSVQPQANPVKGFEEYFLNLTVENNRRNPWFVGKTKETYVGTREAAELYVTRNFRGNRGAHARPNPMLVSKSQNSPFDAIAMMKFRHVP